MRWCMCLPSWSATLQDTSEAGRLWSVTQVRVTSSPGLASSPPVRLTELGPTETSSNMFISERGLINTYRCSEEQNCSTLCQYTPQFPLRSSLIQELCTCRTRLHHPGPCWPPLLHQCSSCWSWSSQWCDRWAVWRCPTPCHRSGPGGDQTSRSLCCSCTCTLSLGTWSCRVWMIRCWSWAVWRGHSSPPLREIIENQIKYEELYNFISARQEIVCCSSKSVFTLLWWTMISCETKASWSGMFVYLCRLGMRVKTIFLVHTSSSSFPPERSQDHTGMFLTNCFLLHYHWSCHSSVRWVDHTPLEQNQVVLRFKNQFSQMQQHYCCEVNIKKVHFYRQNRFHISCFKRIENENRKKVELCKYFMNVTIW